MKVVNIKLPLQSFAILFLLFSTCSLNSSAPINAYAKNTPLELSKSPIDKVDAIICINLKRRADKWHRMEKIFKHRGITLTRFDAIDGWSELNCTKFKEDCFFNTDSNLLNPGEMGCLLSHYSVWKLALEQGLKTVWILEDDVCIKQKLRTLPKTILALNKSDPNWDVLYTDRDFFLNLVKSPSHIRGQSVLRPNLDFIRLNSKDRLYPTLMTDRWYKNSFAVSAFVKSIRCRFGLHSIIFSSRGLKKLVDHFSKLQIIFPADIEIFLTPGLRMYASLQTYVGQNFSTMTSDTSFKP